MFFARNEIHIQAFQEIPPAKLMSGDSSSLTFHDFQEFIISDYQKIRNSEFQKLKFRNSEFQKFKNRTANVSDILEIIKVSDSQI